MLTKVSFPFLYFFHPSFCLQSAFSPCSLSPFHPRERKKYLRARQIDTCIGRQIDREIDGRKTQKRSIYIKD
ncbi:hypothetical protein CSUI_010403 [Cystoisospora suis]|uniref:Uncharacterized protein n=1 Tax=Cystoisospora suis TaxID=483139 RepID=A0A2C6KGW7_9APIC|nr:hypothetical protein CSUI_010403 [Cystoisospora suis]